MGEYSEPGGARFGTVTEKLMAETLSTFTAQHLQSHLSLMVLFEALLGDWFGEGRPRSAVLVLSSGLEERVLTLAAHVCAVVKVVPVDFTL